MKINFTQTEMNPSLTDGYCEYGEIKKEWLSSFLELPNGIPSHDTFNRFFPRWMLMYLTPAFYHG